MKASAGTSARPAGKEVLFLLGLPAAAALRREKLPTCDGRAETQAPDTILQYLDTAVLEGGLQSYMSQSIPLNQRNHFKLVSSKDNGKNPAFWVSPSALCLL